MGATVNAGQSVQPRNSGSGSKAPPSASLDGSPSHFSSTVA